MAKRKRELTPEQQLAQQIYATLKPQTVGDVTEGLKKIFGPMIEAALQGELENHLGYDHHERTPESKGNSRNGYSKKTIKTSQGETEIKVPRDRNGSFEPQIVPKYKRDISEIEDKIIAMYGRGMSQRDIAQTIDEIYGFKLSAEQVSNITDYVVEAVEEWQTRPLEAFYPFAFVDCMYVSMRTERGVRNVAVYTVLAYSVNGRKDILGLWIGDTESKHFWMQVFDELKSRGVEDLGFLSIDGVSGLEAGAKSIFPHVVVQRCIVHLIRNSTKYIPRKEWSRFTKELRTLYSAINVQQARKNFEAFKEHWAAYPGALRVWENNFTHVEQLYNYGGAVRKLMYTTNAIESVNSSFRKVTKQGAFPNETAVFKLLYLRVQELYAKWNNRMIPGWSNVRNQLEMDERMSALMHKYDKAD